MPSAILTGTIHRQVSSITPKLLHEGSGIHLARGGRRSLRRYLLDEVGGAVSFGLVDLLAEGDVGGLGGDLPAVLALELRSTTTHKRASKTPSARFAIEREGQSEPIEPEGGEGKGNTDLEVVGEVGVIAAAAGLQVGEAVQLRAHQQRVVHHLGRLGSLLGLGLPLGSGPPPPTETETKRRKGRRGFCFASPCGLRSARLRNGTGRNRTGIL